MNRKQDGDPPRFPAWLKAKIARARQVLAPEGGLAAAYVYGSSLRTPQYEDIDLALLPRPRARLPSARALTALALKLDRVFEAETDVHLVCELTDPLRFRIVREGRRFLTKDELAAVRFESETLIRFLDFKPTYDRLNQAIPERRTW